MLVSTDAPRVSPCLCLTKATAHCSQSVVSGVTFLLTKSKKRKARKPLGPRQTLAAEAARLAEQMMKKFRAEGPQTSSVPLEAFDPETGWFDPPPKQETPRQTLKRFMRMPR